MSGRRVALLFLASLPVGMTGASHAAGTAYRIIVNPATPQNAIDRRVLAEIFLKKVTRWNTGDTIHPVDQHPDSPARQRFSDEILGRSVAAVRNFWAQAVFAGRDVPPPELDDDDEVVRFVLKHAGAVGYVSAAANVDRVKVLGVR
jgi:ABC-type phosphate transport system substrate-binding protein